MTGQVEEAPEPLPQRGRTELPSVPAPLDDEARETVVKELRDFAAKCVAEGAYPIALVNLRHALTTVLEMQRPAPMLYARTAAELIVTYAQHGARVSAAATLHNARERLDRFHGGVTLGVRTQALALLTHAEQEMERILSGRETELPLLLTSPDDLTVDTAAKIVDHLRNNEA